MLIYAQFKDLRKLCKNDTNTNKNVFKNIFFDKVNAVSLDHFLQF